MAVSGGASHTGGGTATYYDTKFSNNVATVSSKQALTNHKHILVVSPVAPLPAVGHVTCDWVPLLGVAWACEAWLCSTLVGP